MKKFLSILMLTGVVLLGGTQVFAGDLEDARAFFDSYVNAANTYSPTIESMYSPKAKITRQVVKPDGTLVNVDTDTATYMKQLKLGQAGAKLRKYKNTYSDIKVEKSGNGYKVSSLRQPSGETYKLKTYMVVTKQPDGKWLITEEMMQTKVQTFLKYANK
ncbi:hypothetical protein J6A31_08515 [bacterium]|nr:hypothetical protein [bacterium]